jgi:endoglucanase
MPSRFQVLRLTAASGILMAMTALSGCQIYGPHEPAAPPPPRFEAFTPISADLQVAEMKRGVNVLAGDPGWKNPSKARFKTAYFKMLHDAGFSTVRIVMNPFDFMDDKGNLDPAWLAFLDKMSNAALAEGLTVILDEHDYEICGKDAVLCRTKLNAFWSIAAPHFKDAPSRVIFEMLNEPHEALTAELWNAQLAETLAIMRASNPMRNVIIGPANWNGLELLPKLVLPADDRHIIVTFHYYHPMEFTHQGAWWVPQFKQLGVTWGSEADYALLDKEFDEVKAWSVANDRPMFEGEFGAYETGAMSDRARWTAAVRSANESRGFAWSYWQFDHDFVLYDTDKGEWVQPILNALIPPAQTSAK